MLLFVSMAAVSNLKADRAGIEALSISGIVEKYHQLFRPAFKKITA